MNRSVMVWSCRAGLFVVVSGALAAAYGCGGSSEECETFGTCGKFDGNEQSSALPKLSGGCEIHVDDEGNAHANCADPQCANLIVCNQRSDGGEHRMILISAHDPNPNLGMKCPDGTDAERLFAGHTGQPTCEPCSCSRNNLQQALTCVGIPELHCTPELREQNTEWQEMDDMINLQCDKPNLVGKTHCVVMNPPKVDPSGCTPSVSRPKDTPSWMMDVFSCPAAPDARTDPMGMCLRLEGDVDCPADWGGTKMVVYKRESGNRACTECQCGGDCSGEFIVYDANNCDGDNPVMRNPSAVVSTSPTAIGAVVGGPYSVSMSQIAPPQNCTPTGGEPAEAVQPADPVTFCCK